MILSPFELSFIYSTSKEIKVRETRKSAKIRVWSRISAENQRFEIFLIFSWNRIKPVLLETELRKLLRRVWNNIIWTEPSRGGSVGSADCTLPFPFGWLPLELKVWDSRFQAGSLQMHSDVRPAQRRYHLRAALADQKTAFLVAQKTELNSRLFVFPGGLVAATDSWVTASVMTPVGWEADPAAALKDNMLRIFSSGDFWKGL